MTMMSVLMWTGTFLHDFAEGHKDDAVFGAEGQCSSPLLQLKGSEQSEQAERGRLTRSVHQSTLVAIDEVDAFEHVHCAVIVSKVDPLPLHAQLAASRPPAILAADTGLIIDARYQRPPPAIQTRIYLDNRHLII